MSFLNRILAVPLGYIMKGCYWVVTRLNLPLAYVFALLLFTVVTKLLMFPLMMKQQKSTVMMSVFSPMIREIQTKYKNNQEKQNEELYKLAEYGYSPTAGCMPMLVNLLIMFGLVEVIYKPLSYMLTLPKELITSLANRTIELSAAAGNTIAATDRMIETYIIQNVKTNFSAFSEFTAQYAAELERVRELEMSIGNIHLYEKPVLGFNLTLLIPLFSIVTMLISTLVSMKSTGSLNGEAGNQAKTMMLTSSIMFAVFSFMYPMGFSLYWGFQNILSILQNFILKKMYDPEKMKAEVDEKIKQKKKERNARKTITYTDRETGKTVEKEVSANESDRIRLQRAREIDRERYGDE